MQIKTFTVNHFGQNTSLILDESTKICAIVDPGCFFEKEKLEIKNYIIDNGYKLENILFTHCHLDHAFGAKYIYNEFSILNIFGHKEEKFFIDDAINQSLRFGINMEQPPNLTQFIDQGDIVTVGSLSFDCIHVPGHTQGSICFYNKEHAQIIVGDVLFAGSVGRSDLPGGNGVLLIEGIKSKLMVLPENVTVHCGHGPTTTIGTEKASNPFLQ